MVVETSAGDTVEEILAKAQRQVAVAGGRHVMAHAADGLAELAHHGREDERRTVADIRRIVARRYLLPHCLRDFVESVGDDPDRAVAEIVLVIELAEIGVIEELVPVTLLDRRHQRRLARNERGLERVPGERVELECIAHRRLLEKRPIAETPIRPVPGYGGANRARSFAARATRISDKS